MNRRSLFKAVAAIFLAPKPELPLPIFTSGGAIRLPNSAPLRPLNSADTIPVQLLPGERVITGRIVLDAEAFNKQIRDNMEFLRQHIVK